MLQSPAHFLDFISSTNTIYIGYGVLFLVVACIIWRLLSQKRQKTFSPHGTLTSPEQIHQLLDEVSCQRQMIGLQPTSSPATNRQTLKCTITSLDRQEFTVETISTILADHWVGRTVCLSFRVSLKGRYLYYTCTTTIQKISTVNGNCRLTFPLPQSVQDRQQRSFLRIEPPVELIYGASIWYGDTMPGESQLPDLCQWLKPALFYIPGTIEQFGITDLSASGLQLFFPKTVTTKHALRISTLDRFILMLDLYDPEKAARLRIWLQCKAQRIAPKETSDSFHTGAQFIAWGKPRTPASAEHPGAIEWFRIASSREVEPLSSWIMHRHLDKFRLLDDNTK